MFFDGVFLSIYSHLLKKLELSKLCRKKLGGGGGGYTQGGHPTTPPPPAKFFINYKLFFGPPCTYNCTNTELKLIKKSSTFYLRYFKFLLQANSYDPSERYAFESRLLCCWW